MELRYLRRETRYGVPAADKVLFNRHYVLGYSYYFRQAKWALEIVDSGTKDIDRLDNFRQDFRIPVAFRPDLGDYKYSGYDRGHLVASANQNEIDLQNSETFLLSNMSPQKPDFNRQIWKELESEVRSLDAKASVLETYVITGPLFYFDQLVESIGIKDGNDVTVPVPHAFFKSILTENKTGSLDMWSFIIPNDRADKELKDYRVPTTFVEKVAGIELWENLRGDRMDEKKEKVRKMW